MLETDVLIIGSGAAGLQSALQLAAHKRRIILISKSSLQASSTYWAQGGIAAPLDKKDSIDRHLQDTLAAGMGLCDEGAARFIIEQSQAALAEIVELGFPVSRREKSGEMHLHKEGGHSHRRIMHAADRTGKALTEILSSKIRDNPYIQFLDHHQAVNLIERNSRCLGAHVFNIRNEKVFAVAAKYTVLATGGASRVYYYSTNPDGATGDGIAMAYRAGCRIANMEFNQFHPTCLYHPQVRSFLISEALRGEGGKLLLPDGSSFMHKFDKRAELAPRDIVARSIDHEMKKNGLDHIYLDISHRPSAFVKKHFPTIYEQCLDLGIDITKQAIPVVPAAHYICGGIMTDLAGKTDLDALYAIGETAYTGLHGANRLASNSLLECLVMATAASKSINQALMQENRPSPLPDWDESQVRDSDEEVVISHNWEELRYFMWNYVGIVRTNKRLARALHRINLLQQEIKEYYGNYRINSDLLELRNLAVCAELIIHSAISRRESRGLHFNLDYPRQMSSPQPSVLRRGASDGAPRIHKKGDLV